MANQTDEKVTDADRQNCRVDRAILRQARHIAAHEDIGLSEVIERDLRPAIRRRFEKIAAEIGGEAGA